MAIFNCTCAIPPKHQFRLERQQQENVNTQLVLSQKKIAFLLMLMDDLPFSNIWNHYFTMEPNTIKDDFILYIHIQQQSIPYAMDYNEYIQQYENSDLNLDRVVELGGIIRILPTQTLNHWGHLLPAIVSFWDQALRDERELYHGQSMIAGFLYLSSSCIPLKPLSQLQNDLLSMAQETTQMTAVLPSIFYFSGYYRRKAALWSFISRQNAQRLLEHKSLLINHGRLCRTVSPIAFGSEELCPPILHQYHQLPTRHGMLTYDCWACDTLLEYSNSVPMLELVKQGPCEFRRVDRAILQRLYHSGAYFARKFTKDCSIVDSTMSFQQYIVQLLDDYNDDDLSEEKQFLERRNRCPFLRIPHI